MKTFDELFAELSAKVAAADPTSGTVQAVRDGVHAAGKKVVEEASESWMAAEHETDERTAEEISQLLYRVQVLMLTRGSRSTTSTLTSDPDRHPEGARPVLRIAVPNKGVLSEPAAEMLAESGYRQRRSTKDLAVYDPDNDTEFFYLRPRDIAVYVAAGTLDVGITGRDMLLETAPNDGEGHAAVEVMPLGFGRSSFRFATPVESRHRAGRPARRQADRHRLPGAAAALPRGVRDQGRRGQARRCGRDRLPARAWPTRSATSSRPGRRCARPACTSSASRCSTSEAILVRREGAEEIPAVAQLRRRLQGVMVARQYVMLDYDCPNELLARATAVTPGLEGPTVSPLQTPGWSAVRAMVRQTDTNRVMDELWELGARAILVTSIHASRI